MHSYKAAYDNFRTFSRAEGVELPFCGTALEQWKTWNKKRGIAATTNNSYWRMLRPFFRYVSNVTGAPDPFLGAKAPGIPRAQDRVPKALHPNQLEQILDAAEHYPWRTRLQRDRAVALMGIMMYAGLRKGEVLRLKFGDVDFADKTIVVRGGKGRFGGKDRVVAMPATLRVMLSRYVATRNSRFRAKPESGAPPQFFVSKNNRGLSESQFRRIVRIVRASADVPFFPHALRHSYISMLLRSRAPLHVVQALAGHNDIETTQRYIATFDDEKRRAVARLPRFLR